MRNLHAIGTKLSRTSSVLILTIFLVSTSMASTNTDKIIINNIKQIYSKTYEIIKYNKAKIIILYSESGKDGYDIKKWHISSNKNYYDKGAYEARVFIADKKIIKTRFVTQSLSGDWAKVVEYYYYSDGKVAFIYEGNTTYNGYIVKNGEKIAPEGPFIVEKRSYLSKDGKRIKYIEKAFLKLTKEKVPIEQIQKIDLEKYDSICSLPFVDIIKNEISTNCVVNGSGQITR